MSHLPRLIATLSLVFLPCLSAWAQLGSAVPDEFYREITRAGLQNVPLAFPPALVRPGGAQVAPELQAVLDQDLDWAAGIEVVPRELYRLVKPHADQHVVFESWRGIGAQYLLELSVDGESDGGEVVIEAKMLALDTAELSLAKRYRSRPGDIRAVAHRLANDVVRALTGKAGSFRSRIAYVSDRSGNPEIWMMDWDGANQRQLTDHKSVVLNPTFSPDGKQIAFTSFLRGDPALYLLRPEDGHLRLLYDQGGVNSSPAFSPDGQTIAFASARAGNTDIYTISVEGGHARKLTSALAIDTQPSWAANGRQLAFTSARDGRQQIYMMDSDGSNVRRVTFDREQHDEATFSPITDDDQAKIVCTVFIDNSYQIATVELVGAARKVIRGPGSNESPVFSPDGTLIAFSSTRTGNSQIYITDGSGRPRRITSRGTNHSASWIAID